MPHPDPDAGDHSHCRPWPELCAPGRQDRVSPLCGAGSKLKILCQVTGKPWGRGAHSPGFNPPYGGMVEHIFFLPL
jgi:hypothetical protein